MEPRCDTEEMVLEIVVEGIYIVNILNVMETSLSTAENIGIKKDSTDPAMHE